MILILYSKTLPRVSFTINGDDSCSTIHQDDRGIVWSIRVRQIECQSTANVASIFKGERVELDRAVEDECCIVRIKS